MADVAAYLVSDTPYDPEQSHFEPGDGDESEEDGNNDDIFTDCAGDAEDDGLGPVHISDLDSAAPIVVEELPPPSVTGDPEDWAVPDPNAAAGEPAFDAVDNPFNAGSFVYRPKIEKGVYKGHYLPTGACPVPKGPDGARQSGGWTFDYGGETVTGKPGLKHVTDSNPFPKERSGKLDAVLLKQLGLNAQRMHDGDALWFFQCLFPICDTSKSGVPNDPRKNFFSRVEIFTNKYALSIGLGGTYGHKFENVTAKELANWWGVIFRDAALGGSGGALHRRFKPGNSQSDSQIERCMTERRYLQIKRVMKLNDNDTSPKKGEDGYSPTYKYDMISEVTCANTNALSELAGSDLGGDETTFPAQGYGESGAGVISRITGKPGVTKGGQDVIVVDRDRIRVRACMHRHKLNPKRPGIGAAGPNEVLDLMAVLKPMVQGEDPVLGVRQIFSDFPTTTWDNFFSGDNLMEHEDVGDKWPIITTVRRDRLPGGVPAEYMHKQKTQPGGKRPKAARDLNPIVMTKGNRTHVTFQSTSSCNIGGVNVGGKVKYFTTPKSRGRGNKKRTWEIENNTYRQRYLGTYWTVDRLDHLVKQLNLFYVSWKYWHSPMRHWMGIAAVTAYSMYQECADGELDPTWKLQKQLSFWEFTDKLASGLLAYTPTERKYPGDSKMRISTSQHKRRRSGGPAAASESVGGVTIMHKTTLLANCDSGRLLGQFDQLYSHFDTVNLGHGFARKCAVCGDDCYSECAHPDCASNGKGVPLHFFERKGNFQLRPCFVQYHDTTFCGLARCDYTSMGKKRSDFKPAGKKQRLDYAAAVKSSLAIDEDPIPPAAAAAAVPMPVPGALPAPVPPPAPPAVYAAGH